MYVMYIRWGFAARNYVLVASGHGDQYFALYGVLYKITVCIYEARFTRQQSKSVSKTTNDELSIYFSVV